MFFTSVGPQDTHCHTMYLLQLGTGFDRVLNTLALYGVVQLNSQTNASFTKTRVTLLLSPFSTRVVIECQFPQCYGSVGSDGWRGHGLFSCACRNIILHPNPFFKEILEFNCPALSHAAVSISCMAGAETARFPALFLEVLFKGGTWLG